MRKKALLSIFLTLSVVSLFAQGFERGQHEFVIRGEVVIDLEPIYAGHVDEAYPLDAPTAGRRALEEAALFFSAMIYGWSFHYDVGERARQIDEVLELEAQGVIQFGDPSLRVTDTETRDSRLRIWADYHLNETQQRRMRIWRTGMIRNTQGVGYGPIHLDENPGWLAVKNMALEDAARSAIRAMLRGSERNRPKQVTGIISLSSFPRFFIDSGRWAAAARFRVQIIEIVPFSAF